MHCTTRDSRRGDAAVRRSASRVGLGHPVKRAPLIGLNALIGSVVTLVFPTVLGRSIDSIVAGADPTQWLIAVAGLIPLGMAASLIDVFKGGTDAAHPALTAVTAIAAAGPPVGGLVLLAAIDARLAVAFFGGMLLTLAARWAFARWTADVRLADQDRVASLSLTGTTASEGIRGSMPELQMNGVVAWRILARPGGQASILCLPVLVAVLAVGGLRLAAGEITAGDLFAAAQYAVLGAGLGNVTDVLREMAQAHRATEPLPVKSIARHRATGAAVQRDVPGRRHQFVA
jgi:ATP-binding cassette, subfamily B, bacterial